MGLQKAILLHVLANLADNESDKRKEGDDTADPQPYLDLTQLIECGVALDHATLTAQQRYALAVANEEAAEIQTITKQELRAESVRHDGGAN
jgi:replicative superfamily II helicase